MGVLFCFALERPGRESAESALAARCDESEGRQYWKYAERPHRSKQRRSGALGAFPWRKNLAGPSVWEDRVSLIRQSTYEWECFFAFLIYEKTKAELVWPSSALLCIIDVRCS